ncbi:metal ABC transporter ATP-binding protein [Pelagicoccus albus]|uniref:ATP-binding cassette domain-containing protein n=1 Tax=Pelagicoccus albus TaxID=415222 RepID=A0A7X1B8U0_9BACT|nr:ATP-binding cassette domain-containing protein [Pelagicoccus albus]MBC2607827.1 ATP-binding cassette domain-containing protein [Pelagicoccus albus]
MTSPLPLSIDNLSFNRGGQSVLEKVSLRIEGPGLYGLIGPNGGGKSTLLNLILGLLNPTSGQIRVFDKPPAKAASKIGFVPQAAKFDREFPVTLKGLVETGLLGPKLWSRNSAKSKQSRVNEALKAAKVEPLAKRALSALSGGELQRGLIARALATNPEMLLFDEPTASVDHSHAASLFELMCKLGQHRPIIVVSHDLAQIAAHCDQVFCMEHKLWEAPEKPTAASLANQIFGGEVHCHRKEECTQCHS